MNLDKIAAILDKDGGLLNVGVVEQLGFFINYLFSIYISFHKVHI